MAVVYKQTELQEGTPLQFLGVYATRWEPDWGDPTVGFLDEVRKEIESILRKLVGERSNNE